MAGDSQWLKLIRSQALNGFKAYRGACLFSDELRLMSQRRLNQQEATSTLLPFQAVNNLAATLSASATDCML